MGDNYFIHYNYRLSDKDKKIRAHIGEQIFEGTAKNIAEDGRLEIEINGEIKLFSVGEITIEKDYY
mgnify:CR=1 FL=1